MIFWLTCDIPLRLDVFVKIGLHIGKPLLDASFYVATPLSHISKQSAGEAKICVCLGEDLHVEHVKHSLVV